MPYLYGLALLSQLHQLLHRIDESLVVMGAHLQVRFEFRLIRFVICVSPHPQLAVFFSQIYMGYSS